MLQSRLFILICLLTFAGLGLSAQTLHGRVYITGTETPVADASVYYNASMVGTATDGNGEFALIEKAGHIPLIVSCVGYYSSTVTHEPGKPLIVYLKPRAVELNTITIRARGTSGLDRKQAERLFIQEFLGISEFAKSCTIVNLTDVDLFYHTKTATLTADCDQPIIIRNKRLGYVITYYLDNFSRTLNSTHYAGNFIFKEYSTIIRAEHAEISSNREKVYTGSRMQFVRALWNNSLDKAGFRITNQKKLPIDASQILRVDSLSQKYIYLENPIAVFHSSDPDNKNIINSTKPYLFIDKNGFYQQGLQWTGPMSDQRMGDQLPYEYRSKNDPVENAPITNANSGAITTAIAASPSNNMANAKTAAGTTVPVFFEKVYLHTDRDTYAQGEDIWFKAYLVNAQNNGLINYSHNLYVELISPMGKIVQRKMLRLENGLADGDFKLADTLITGNYRLRAYTNWMRNFGDNFIFEKNIRIVAGLGGAQVEKAALAGKNSKKTNTAAAIATANQNTLPVVRFFPEGGAMVSGVSGIIAVKAEDANGRGIAANGSILDNGGETIAGFICDSLGFGAFTLLPDAAQHYQALVNIGQKDQRFVLPGVAAIGFNMHVQDKQHQLTVAINCNDVTFSKYNGQRIYLEVKHGGKTCLKQPLLLTDKSLLVKLPDDKLVEGISSVSVADAKNQPLCERLIYIPQTNNIQLIVNTDKTAYQPKAQATVRITLNKPGIAHLSLSAVDALTVPVQPENIVSYLELQSEVRGHIEQAARYFDTTNVNRLKQLDLLLLTQGWRGFVWKRLEDTTLTFDREVEQGITITGRVRRQMTDKPMAGMHISLHAPKAEGDKFFEANTDTAGRFAIYGPVFYGYQYLNFSSRNFDEKSNSGGWIKVDSLNQDVLPINAVNNLIMDTLPSAEETMMRLKVPKKQQLKEVKIKAKVFRETPEVHNVTMHEQKDYGNVMQYLLSVIDGASTKVVLKGDPPTVEVHLKSPTVTGHDLLDIAVSGYYADGSKPGSERVGQDILTLPMTSVLSATLTKRVLVQDGLLHYFVSLKLRPGAFAMKDYFDNTTTDMVGYYKARVFYIPKFGSIDDSTDPRRNTIHWEPNIVTDDNGEATVSFYNTEQTGNVRLVVQGVSNKGEPLAASAAYLVK